MKLAVRFVCLILLSMLVSGRRAYAAEPPRIVHKDGRFALFVDGKPFLMLGGQMNNSSEWPSALPDVWAAVARMHVNTLAAPVYWEQMEPTPGTFDYANVDQLIHEAREHHVHLLLLWFGASKNGQMHYVPEWVKTNTQKYPRLTNSRGQLLDILDDNAPSNLEADKLAFTTLMRHLKKVDGEEHTILMVQVENEAGPYYADRDYTEQGNKLFAQQVPGELVAAFHKQPGNWHDVFGMTDNETFATWSEARYINALAEAGKAEFNIPMYVNVAAVNTPNRDSVNRALDIWKTAAPSSA